MRTGHPPRPRTALLVPLAIALASVGLPGCVQHARQAAGTASVLPASGGDARDPDPAPQDAEADRILALVGAEDPNQPAIEGAAPEAPVEEPGPYEWVERSPLDDLAAVEPNADLLPDIIPPDDSATPSDLPIEVNERVQFWIDFYTNRYRERFRAGLERSGRYLPMFRRIFEEQGLPRDLVYMAHVESGFKDNAYSRAKAMGIWQFIAGTGRHYGLRIDGLVDERRDPEKSARAAAAYLKKLHGDFGDWYLAMAAYNAGEGKISRGLAATGRSDFWGLAETRHIRAETKNYVPAILAAILIAKDPARYGMAYEADAELLYDTVPVDGAADFRVLAQCAGVSVETLVALNPALRRQQTPPHATTDVRVPAGNGAGTRAAMARIPANERVLYTHHRVRKGETLSVIARSYGVDVGDIQQANRMGRKTVIHVGQELTIPSSAGARITAPVETASGAAPSREGKPIGYTVRRGETLSEIARRYATSPRAIAAASGISVGSTLRVGQRLKVTPRAASTPDGGRAAKSQSVASAKSGVRQHTVRRGDTLWRIATLYSTSIEQLCSLNGISRNDKLFPGTRITVRP